MNGLRWLFLLISGCICLSLVYAPSYAQPELSPRANLTGIRIDGQIMKFATSICLIGPSMMEVRETGREDQRSIYKRNGDKQTVSTELSHFALTETVLDSGEGMASLTIEVKAVADTTISGLFLCFDLPADDYAGAAIRLIDSTASLIEPISLFPGSRGRMPGSFRMRNFIVQASARGFRVQTATRTIEVSTAEPTEFVHVKGNPRFGNPDDKLYLALMVGHTIDGQTGEKTFVIKTSGEIDRTPAHISIDLENPGRQFDGLGGNFRLQNEELDPKVIDYCLEHLNVRWARVELPWRNWHPVEGANPLDRAREGKIDPSVRSAMAMAQQFSKRHIPVILSTWSAPMWAIVGEPNFRNENGIFGNPLNPRKMRSIIKSLGDYFVYLKEAFGVEPDLFSFNESDLGISVRMTGQEHAEFIKKLGAYLASRELTTKMLLGDNSDATSIDFIEPALTDPATHEYIGAISFHAWRGCDNWTLSNWADAARQLNVPLVVGEGGVDAQAFQYPDIFNEPAFAQNEIDTYVRSIAVAHVRSILQWQLTADYSLLTGEGIYGTEGRLRPTQRFWNLKQLGMVPAGSFIYPCKCDNEEITCAAFGDVADGNYAVHMVNNGASRSVTLTGLPEGVREFRVYVTDKKREMDEAKRVHVTNGSATITLEGFAFTSLFGATSE